MLSIINTEIRIYWGSCRHPVNATVFTHPKQTKANLTSGLHKRANKYLTWYFNGSSFVIYNSFQRDEVILPHNLLGFNYTVKKNTTTTLLTCRERTSASPVAAPTPTA